MSRDLIVVATVGDTVPASHFYQNISIRKPEVDAGQVSELMAKARQSITTDIFFPLVPQSLQPGIMKSVRFSEPKNLQPFAVIGMDRLSMEWIAFRRETLAELNAPIYVVQAASFADIQSLAAQNPDLKFVASSGDGIGRELNVGSYPFLVTGTGVWQ